MEPRLKDRKERRKGGRKKRGRDWMYSLLVVIRLRTKVGIIKNGRVKIARLETLEVRNERTCSWV